MNVFDEYKPSSRQFAHHYLKTRLLGIVPIALAFFLIRSQGYAPGPGLWCASGIGLALHLIVMGVHDAIQPSTQRSAFTSRLAADPDQWFPSFLVIIQNSFTALTILLFWFTICELGFEATLFENVLIPLLIIVAPFRRITRGLLLQDPKPERQVRMAFLNSVNVILVTLLVARMLTILFLTEEDRSSSEFDPTTIFIWVPAILIVMISGVMFASRIMHGKRTNHDGPLKEEFDQTPNSGKY